MRIYVGTYKKYNEGSLEGDWLDLNDYSDKEEFLIACRELHKDEKEPELMFQDYDADESWESYFYSEYGISEDYWTAKEMIQDSGLSDEIIGCYLECNGYDSLKSIQNAIDCYVGTYNSKEDFAIACTENDNIDYDSLPYYIRCAIDWNEVARQLEMAEYDLVKDSNYNYVAFWKNV